MSTIKIVLDEDQERYLREHYPVDSQRDIADWLHISPPTVRRLAMELGLEKSKNYDRRRYFFRYVRNYKDERYRNYKAA